MSTTEQTPTNYDELTTHEATSHLRLINGGLCPSASPSTMLDRNFALPYDIEIEDWDEQSEKYKEGVGTITTTSVRTLTNGDDGSAFELIRIRPDRPLWDIKVDLRTPLGTPIAGYNMYVAIQLAKAGIESRIVGTNLASRKTTLTHDALASLVISNEDDRQGQRNPISEAGRSIYSGYSMGIMKQFAELGMATQVGRSVDLTIGLDPSAAEKVNYTPEEVFKFGSFMLQEAAEIPQIFIESLRDTGLRRTVCRTRHLIRTFSLDPRFLVNTVGKLDVIASGETGTFIADIPPDAAMIIHSFRKSVYNDGKTYERLIGGHPNAHVVFEENGRHTSGARISSIAAVVAKITHGQRLIDDGVSGSELAEALRYPILQSSLKHAA